MEIQSRLTHLMALPWTIESESQAEGRTVITIRELPEFVVVGKDEAQLEREFWDALESLFESYLEHGDRIPTPRDLPLPWEQPASTVIEFVPQAPQPARSWAGASSVEEPMPFCPA